MGEGVLYTWGGHREQRTCNGDQRAADLALNLTGNWTSASGVAVLTYSSAR